MNTIKRRIERLEQSDNNTQGLAERLEAALKRWEEGPEESHKELLQTAERCIAETDVALRDGRYVSELELRITHAYRSILRDEAEGRAA